MFNMVVRSKLSPLMVTEEAQSKLLFVRLNKNIPKEQRLRVQSTENAQLGILGFHMLFDEKTNEGDGIYDIGPLELILDNNTAHHLVGSTLAIGDDGDFTFIHLETYGDNVESENIVYN